MVLVSACAVWVAAVTGCLEPRVYACDEDDSCVLEGVDGVCEAPGYCAYQDDTCASGIRFGPSADSFANDCVPPGGVSGSNSETSESGTSTMPTTSVSASGTTSDPMTCDTGCNVAPTPCHIAPGECDTATNLCVFTPKPLGDSCTPDDPCLTDGTCNGAGVCDGPPIDCDQPGPCRGSPGTCDSATGECTYPLLGAGSPCEDGNDCTQDDNCDSEGVCVPGEVCPSDNPCETAECIAGSCMTTALADGTSCGPRAADRCCGSTCVDNASDGAHCGGCGMSCMSDESCESVATTTTCDPAPADTTGRCTCSGLNSDCPNGQVCRNATPFIDRCAPVDASDCTSNFTDVSACPNFCGY